MAEELKPCPFCGGVARTMSLLPHFTTWNTSCRNPKCAVAPFTRTYNTEVDAITAWNQRLEAGDDLPKGGKG